VVSPYIVEAVYTGGPNFLERLL